MVDATEEVLKFVLLLEVHKDVLSKSQTSLNKKKKEEAAALLIPKWLDISKSQLTQASLLKKINNLKNRARSALKCGKKLTEWQNKLLQLIQNDNCEGGDDFQRNETDIDEESVSDTIPATSKANAEQILNELETDQTKLLNNEQLQRYVLLQQLQVVMLQRKRLENLNCIENGKNVTFDFIGFEEEMVGVNPTTTKN